MQHHQREKRSKVFKAHAFGNGQNNKEKMPGTFKKIKEHHVRHVLPLLLTYCTQQSTVIYTHDKSYKIGGHYTMYIHINKISRLELGHDSLSLEVYYLK